MDKDISVEKDEEEKVFYKEAFDAFDWNRNGTIPTSVSFAFQALFGFFWVYLEHNVFYILNKIRNLARSTMNQVIGPHMTSCSQKMHNY